MGCSGSKSTETANSQKKDETPKENGETGQQQEQEEEVYVTVEEAVTYIQNELLVPEERARKMVAKINQNDDGKVSNRELNALWEKIKDKREELLSKFREVDKDDNGFVSLEEGEKIIKEQFPGLEEEHYKAIVKSYDKDGDGKVSYKEFVAFYCQIKLGSERLAERFKELDKDDSGTLNSDEICGILEDECALEPYMAHALVDYYDKNNDKQINKEEFKKMWAQMFA